VLVAVGPREVLRAGDQLVFVGILDSVVDLQRVRGMVPATDQTFKLDAPKTTRSLIEAVVSDRCPIIGKTIREGRFRNRYKAAVIAVARGGERVRGKIGDIVLKSGDTLLLEAQASFADEMRHASDFFLVSRVENSAPLRHDRAWVALGILGMMVALATIGILDMLAAAMLAGGLMILTRCCTGPEARKSIDWPVLIVIGAALGVGQAMETSGAAGFLAGNLIGLAGGNPWLVLLLVYLVTTLFTELITNNAAAVLVFPIALVSAQGLGVDFMPFVITIMVAASASFATPIGYQTNLMVYGPGGYKFSDYLRFGLPLNVLFCITTVALVPFIWPFQG
jgi:di/tricarboxylate transporter